MTFGVILGVILLPIVWMMMASANKAHKDETGVPGPSRQDFRNIRRNARKKGISNDQAYQEWLGRKQRKRKFP